MPSVASIQRATALAAITISTIVSHTPAYGMAPDSRCSHGRALHRVSVTSTASHATNSMPTL